VVEGYGDFDASEFQDWRDPLDPFGAGESDPADVFDADVFGSSGGVVEDARRAGDAVDALDKITAQMSGGEHRPNNRRCAAPSPRPSSPAPTWWCRRVPAPESPWPISSRPR
jgi:hypothetical protein